MIFGFNFPRIDDKLDEGENLFQKKPLGKRRHLMSGAVTRREFSVRYVWNGAKARFRWNRFSPSSNPLSKCFPNNYQSIELK